jgi:cytochrome P450
MEHLDLQNTSSFSSALALFAGIFAVGYLTLKSLNKPKGRLPPSFRSLPIVGSMPFLTDLPELPRFFLETSETLGPVFSLKLGSLYAVVLNNKQVIREALVTHAVKLAGRNGNSHSIKLFNPNQHGIIEGQYGAAFRKYLQLTLSILKEFGFGLGLMEQRISTEVEELVSLIKAHNGKPLYPAHLFSMAAMNVIASIVFGQRLDQTDEQLSGLCSSFHLSVTSKLRYLDYCPMLRFLPYFDKLKVIAIKRRSYQMKFIDESIAKSLTSSNNSFTRRFVECMGPEYDHDELRKILWDLLIAGSETTATSLQWAMALMANHQDIQKRLQNDIDSVVTASRPVSMDDMVNLPYVEASILELMRVKTVLPLALPHMTTEDVQVGGYMIPKNTTVIPNIYSVHRNSDYWPDPDEFRPERFIDDEGKVFGKDRIISFSLGKRSCTGESLARQELFLFFTTLLHNFHILPPEGQDNVECQDNFCITMCPSSFEVRMIPRDT